MNSGALLRERKKHGVILQGAAKRGHMRVLHVALGVPPLRTGGMTRYCCDVMQEQANRGHEIALLYPGRFSCGGTRVKKGVWKGIDTYEVINPLPVALTYGIADPLSFVAPCPSSSTYESFLGVLNPHVIHVHSWQGIHKEFFEIANRRSIPMVFTTHDYYPMCSRCTLVDASGENCRDGASPLSCARCNIGKGMTARRSRLMQSGTYAHFKNSPLVRAAGRKVKDGMSSKGKNVLFQPTEEQISAFEQLLSYNRGIMQHIDAIISNSLITEQVYRRMCPSKTYTHIPITHAGLTYAAARSAKRETDVLHIGYFGGMKRYKGFDVLIDAMRMLERNKIPFQLHLYGDEYIVPSNTNGVVLHGRLNAGQMGDVLRSLDLVVVPSTCCETFSFVVLESLCAGTPVICSDSVGACDIVPKDFIFPSGNAGVLAERIERCFLQDDIACTVPMDYPLSMKEQCDRLDDAYRRVADSVRKRRGASERHDG